ncbi:putative basic-leucine zipper transcription factor [Tieghemostelium lacteum]|uniref:Putative basic-leucine zipper transcription factor n=1 Tax=Tieghemostelium lacteum TaxID=361077 RepID=A0A152A505_TIELA|nr:putative basic-leucine zipper transcription factor [Tieghemostelium lacteum]|eukprot:KYR01318.1 putative basic-leucine zipper transcription factor [Tieghemostelium lacteum]
MDLMDEINKDNTMVFEHTDCIDSGSSENPFLDEFMINFLGDNSNGATSNSDILSDNSSSYNLGTSSNAILNVPQYQQKSYGQHQQQQQQQQQQYTSGSNGSSSYPSSPLVNQSSPLDHCSSSPETPFDFPTTAQYNEFLNSLPNQPTLNINTNITVNNNNNVNNNSPFTGILEQQPPTIQVDHENEKKSSKKRISESRVQTLVHPLTREELLKLTGKEPVKVIDQPTNSLEEERNVKKQRRLIKNRESAQLSRMRKKIYIEDLEKKISDLTSDNNSLKEEVLYLQSIVKQLASEQNLSTQSQTALANYNNQRKNMKAAGVCLLIIFFSFGVFFQNQQQSGTNSLTFVNNNNQNGATTHSLLSLPESSNESTVEQPVLSSPHQNRNNIGSSPDSQMSLLNQNKKRVLETTSSEQHLDVDNGGTGSSSSSSTHQKKRIKITTTEEDNESDVEVIQRPQRRGVGVNNEPTLTPVVLHNNDQRVVPPTSQDTPHSSYIICSDSARIVSQNLTQTTENMLNSNSTSPLTIGLVLPANSLDLGENTIPDRSVIEISCQVSNIRLWNYNGPSNSPLEHHDFENSIVVSTL